MGGTLVVGVVASPKPRSMVKLAFEPLRSRRPLVLILIGSFLCGSLKSCSIMISGKVFNVCDPDMLEFDEKCFKLDEIGGVFNEYGILCPVSSKLGPLLLAFNCFLGVLGIEKTSLLQTSNDGPD